MESVSFALDDPLLLVLFFTLLGLVLVTSIFIVRLYMKDYVLPDRRKRKQERKEDRREN